jgi:hypothetical protein
VESHISLRPAWVLDLDVCKVDDEPWGHLLSGVQSMWRSLELMPIFPSMRVRVALLVVRKIHK